MNKVENIRAAFHNQANSCDALGSPFTARLCRLAAERLTTDTQVGRRILGWEGDASSRGDSVPLRLAGSLNALVVSGRNAALSAVYPPRTADDDALWTACAAALTTDETFLLERLRSAPQTNEVRRSAVLLPGFLTVARLFAKPMILFEVGASAGLNLHWDRFIYDLGSVRWGEPSGVHLAPEWIGPPPPRADIEVQARAGCDLNPLDPASETDRLRLLSYIWADQTDRIERTRSALEIATRNRIPVERADAVDWLTLRLRQPSPGCVNVVYHSIAWQYLPENVRARGEAVVREAGERATADAPLTRLQMEADDSKDGAAISLQIWPTGEKHQIGRADFHGRWVKWTGWPGLN